MTTTIEAAAPFPELAASDVFPDFAVEPAEITKRTQQLRNYVREHMNEGEDYGIVPGGSKPTLFKPGAEKLNAVYGLAVLVEVTQRVEDYDGGFCSFEVKVTLWNKRSGQTEAEGLGSCNSRERRYKNQDAAGVANTVLKMAKKRALVDATLSATRASGMFTQDLEDIDFEPNREERPRRQAAPNSNNAPKPSTGDLITEAQTRAVIALASRVFGRQSREGDLLRFCRNIPLEQHTKKDASRLIDDLNRRLSGGR